MKRTIFDASYCAALLLSGLVMYGATLAATIEPSKRLQATEALLRNLGDEVVLTRAATLRAEKIGLEAFLKSDAKVGEIDGWILVHTPDENIRTIRERASSNLLAWRKAKQSCLSGPMVLNWYAAIKDAVKTAISRLCGVAINFDFDQSLGVTVLIRKKQQVSELCSSFPFILAANGVVLKEHDGALIGQFADFTA